MLRRLLPAACAVTILAACASGARAQWGYPGGYGGWGWGGWGVSTAGGSEAMGLGMLAAGMGQYNLNTAQATSINADTVMRFNEYIWESQQLRNQRYYQLLAERRDRVNESADTIYKRLTENPEATDVYRGDALNVILEQLTRPGVYAQSVSAASTEIPSDLVKQIPFKSAPHAITMSLDELTDARPPDSLLDPRLDAERKTVNDVTNELRTEVDRDGKVSAETLRKEQDALRAFQAKFFQLYPHGAQGRREGENFLRAAIGLSRMLEEPEIQTFLRGLDDTPTTTIGRLLGFMQTFNLRFGVADTPRQRGAYDDLFVKLRTLRDQVSPKNATPSEIAAAHKADNGKRVQDFFSGMELNEIRDRKPLTPAPSPPAPVQP